MERITLNKLPAIFISGLVAVLPFLITIGLIVWMIDMVETVFGVALKLVLPDSAYGPGMGLVFGVLIIFGVGVMTRAIFFREAARWLERRLESIPLINTVYGAVRDLTKLFSRKDGDRQFNKVVMVEWPNMPVKLVGFVTLDDFTGLPMQPGPEFVGVYLPMSYQIGGYVTFLPRECLTPLDMSFEDAMRFVVTAGMSRKIEPEGSGAVIVTPEQDHPTPSTAP